MREGGERERKRIEKYIGQIVTRERDRRMRRRDRKE